MDRPSEEDALILASKLGITRPSTALRLYKDVQAAARVFNTTPRLRPARKLKAAKAFLANLQQRPNHVREIPEDLKPLLGVVDDWETDELLDDASSLLTATKLICDVLENDLTVSVDQKGGRSRDSRVNSFAMALSIIYGRYTTMALTFSIDPETGGLTSAFALFGEEAFEQFSPEDLKTPGTVRNALQSVASFHRSTELMSP